MFFLWSFLWLLAQLFIEFANVDVLAFDSLHELLVLTLALL